MFNIQNSRQKLTTNEHELARKKATEGTEDTEKYSHEDTKFFRQDNRIKGGFVWYLIGDFGGFRYAH